MLDLACLEGLYGIEFAMQGADVLAIEGREENAQKARHAAERLGCQRYEIRVEDVRDLSPERHGTFDVVLCLGILYHLDATDVFRLAQAVADCTTRVALFRTAIGLKGRRSEQHDGRDYHGLSYVEPGSNWSSIGNSTSFWPTRASLLNLLGEVGFTTIAELVGPPIVELDGAPDAICLACVKGKQFELLATPPDAMTNYREARLPERSAGRPHPAQMGRLQHKLLAARYWRKRMRRS